MHVVVGTSTILVNRKYRIASLLCIFETLIVNTFLEVACLFNDFAALIKQFVFLVTSGEVIKYWH